ncbi:MAG: response regulator, partial [Candidatus Heimdallarchaeota archaeon]|nr:response regulator [Candidatus Heimdallarchaeota archaeon]
MKHKILFVDDEKNILTALTRVFIDCIDLEIFTAMDPEEAVKVIKSTDIDLIVSDENMPKIKGSQFLKFVKDMYPDIIRMILTGYANTNSMLSAINNGEVYRYLTKPWKENDLKITILKALEYAELKKQNEKMNKIILNQNDELQTLNMNLRKKVDEKTKQLNQLLTGMKSVNLSLKNNFMEVVELLTGIVSMFQNDLGGHLKRVAELAERICEVMEIEEEEKELIISSAFLHDIGLAGSNDNVFMD